MLAGAATILTLVIRAFLDNDETLAEMDPRPQVLIWTFSLFFLPMFLLGWSRRR